MIVNPYVPYTSTLLENDVNELVAKYSFLSTTSIGFSRLGKPIWSIKFRLWF